MNAASNIKNSLPAYSFHGEISQCPECTSFNIILDQSRGESVCAACGLVLSHHLIDNAREGRRAFSQIEKSKRDQTGSPVSALLPDLGLTTVIDTNTQLSHRMKRIIKWNTRMSWSNRNMLIAATEIKRIGGLLNLPLRVKEYAAKIKELSEIVFYDKDPQTGSIFMEDPSFSFDYAHILPLVEKCSILHGHTSTVMVELVGQMTNNLLLDFADAKRIIKDSIAVLDHKFFINRKYLKQEDKSHYKIAFEGPKGMFDLQVPKDTTYLLEGEATVENLSTELIKILVPKMPKNIEAVGVYVYEGYNKGAHILSKLSKV